jgi:hypothetical protein
MNDLNELKELLEKWVKYIPSNKFDVSVRAVEPSKNFNIAHPLVYADITPLEDMNNTLVVKAWIISAEQSDNTNIKSRSGIVRFMLYSENASSLVGFNENPLLCMEMKNVWLTIKARLSVLHQSIMQAYAGDEGMFAKNAARAFVAKSIEHQWAKDLFVYDINATEGVFDALRKHVDNSSFVKSIEVKNSGNREHSSFDLIRRNYHFLTESTSIPLESKQGLVCLKINEDTQRQIKTLDAGKIFDALAAFCSGGLDALNEFDYVGTPSNSLPEEVEKTGIEAKDPDNDKRLAESAKEQQEEELQRGLFAVAAAAVTPHSAITRRNTLSIHNDVWGDNRSATITAKSPRKVGNVTPCLVMKITENKSEEKMEVEAVLSDSLPNSGRKIVTHSVYASEFPQDDYTIFYEIVSTLNSFNAVIAGTSASDGLPDVAEMLARRKEETLADHSLNITRRIANAGELHRVLATYAHWTADRDPRFTVKTLGFGDFQSTTIRNGVKKLSITTPSDNADDAKAVLEISGVRRVEVTRPTYKEARDEIALMIEELD